MVFVVVGGHEALALGWAGQRYYNSVRMVILLLFILLFRGSGLYAFRSLYVGVGGGVTYLAPFVGHIIL